jgi:hypothetical protein
MTVVPSIIELKGRFPGLGKVWATTVHERLRYAKRKSFHEQVADQIIQSVVKKRKISLLDLDESELSYFCPDSAMLNSRYGDRKLNNTGDNGRIADGAQLTKQMGKRLLLAPSSLCSGGCNLRRGSRRARCRCSRWRRPERTINVG